MLPLPSDLAQQVTTALAEDIGGGDITAQLVPAAQRVTGKVITREEATLCGRPWVTEVFRQLDPAVQLTWHADDGDRVTANQALFEIAGLARPVLTGERTALNFLQLLSATATATRRYVDAIVGPAAQFWIRERRSQDYGRRRNTRSCAAAARTTAWGSSTRC